MSKIKFKTSGELFDVNNVFCVGRNYADHIKEMENINKSSDIPIEPVIFLKTNSAIVHGNCKVRIPEYKNEKISTNLQNEVELVVLIGKDGTGIKESDAMNHVAGYAVGIDFTLRDIQSNEKARGLPWTLSKSFIGSAPVSEAVKTEEISDAGDLDISLKVNGVIRQQGKTSQMIFSLSYIIHYISSMFSLKRGDIIFTGTPSGVTKLNPGDLVEAYIENIGELHIEIE